MPSFYSLEALHMPVARLRAVLAIHHHRHVTLCALLLILVALGLKGWRLYDRAQAVRRDVQALEALAAAKPDITVLAKLEPLLDRTHSDIVALRAEAGLLLPISSRLGWVPIYGSDLAAAEPLLELAVDLTSAAHQTVAALAPLAPTLERGEPLGPALAVQLASARPRLETARQALERAEEARDHIDPISLHPAIQNQMSRIDTLLPIAGDGVDLALALPDLLGAHGPLTYLVIAQNPDELRASGGFITAAGTLTFEQGRLTGFSIDDSIAVDNIGEQVYPDPPEPLQQYMDMELWLFRDSNWSPDFPTAARTAMELYELGQERDIAGVIVVDPLALQMLLSVLGPVSVEGSREPVSVENVIAYVRTGGQLASSDGSQTTPWALHRKAFLAPLARAIFARLGDPSQLDIVALAGAAQRILDERHVQMYLEHPGAAAILARRRWDGTVRPGTHDFLMVVDSNVGYNKVNANIDQAITYTVDLSDPRAPVAELAIAYTNRGVGAPGCSQALGYETVWQIRRYEDWMVGCYWNYLRVLAPAGSQLISATAELIPAEWMDSGVGDDGAVHVSTGEAGTTVLGSLLVIPASEKRHKIFRYRLPATVLASDTQDSHYRLFLQKQAGIEAVPVSVSIRLPAGASIVSTSVPPATESDQTLSFTFRLDRNQQLDIAFRHLP
jgi:hypothetical protein